jgi:hypothetical protein
MRLSLELMQRLETRVSARNTLKLHRRPSMPLQEKKTEKSVKVNLTRSNAD